MSETLFVDSTSPSGWPACTCAPTSGNVTKTMSPSASCAYAVMPILMAPPPPVRSHSCSRVYWRSSGCSLATGGERTARGSASRRLHHRAPLRQQVGRRRGVRTFGPQMRDRLGRIGQHQHPTVVVFDPADTVGRVDL